jgi:hypothetical protein
MDPTVAVSVFGIGAAAIAFWAVVRFPRIGPQSLARAIVVAAVAFLVQTPALTLVGPAVDAYGVPTALLLVILPSLTVLFWATGCIVRSLVLLAAPYRR